MTAISRRFLLAAGASLAVPAMSQAQTQAAETGGTLDKIRKNGAMVIGNGGAYPPFELMADGKLVGFDRDLGDELCKRMGVRADWQVFGFEGLIPALTSGRVDVLITAFTWTPERAKRIMFSDAYYKTGIAAAYRSNLSVEKPAELTGKIVGVQAGTAGEKFVRDGYADKVKQLLTYPEFPLALRDLDIGRIEVVVNTLPTLRYNLMQTRTPGLKVSPVWDSRDVGINTRLGDDALMAEINKQLAAMRGDGFLKRDDAKWFGA